MGGPRVEVLSKNRLSAKWIPVSLRSAGCGLFFFSLSAPSVLFILSGMQDGSGSRWLVWDDGKGWVGWDGHGYARKRQNSDAKVMHTNAEKESCWLGTRRARPSTGTHTLLAVQACWDLAEAGGKWD